MITSFCCRKIASFVHRTFMEWNNKVTESANVAVEHQTVLLRQTRDYAVVLWAVISCNSCALYNATVVQLLQHVACNNCTWNHDLCGPSQPIVCATVHCLWSAYNITAAKSPSQTRIKRVQRRPDPLQQKLWLQASDHHAAGTTAADAELLSHRFHQIFIDAIGSAIASPIADACLFALSGCSPLLDVRYIDIYFVTFRGTNTKAICVVAFRIHLCCRVA